MATSDLALVPNSASPPEPARRRVIREAVLLGLLALTINLAGNGRVSLWDRDEPRYATATREMRASGDLVHPTFNGEPRYHKPILIYWLMLVGTAIGGDNPYGARLISSLAGAGTTLLVWGFGRRLFGPRVGRFAALVAMTAPMLIVEAKLATIDSTLTFVLVACQWALWELSRKASRPAAVVFWVGLAVATLLKGPIGPVLLVLAAMMSWYWRGPVGYLRRLEWRWGIAVYSVLTIPWYLAIGIISRGEYYRVAFGFHVVTRLTKGIEQHGGFPGYYPVLTMVTFHPWSAFIPVAIYAAWARRKENPNFGFLLGWVVGPLILLEIARTKLLHYYVPALPACALLIGWLLVEVEKSAVNLRRWPLGRLAIGLQTGIGIGSTVLLLAGVMILPWNLRWPCLAIAAVIATGTLLSVERFYSGVTEGAARVLAVTWGVVMFLVGSWLMPSAEPYRVSRIVGLELKRVAAKEGAVPMLASFQQPSVIYALGSPAETFTTRDRLAERVRKDGRIVTALMPHEMAILRKDPRLRIELKDVISGYNVDKGRNENLQLVVLKPGEVPMTASRPGQKTVVK